MDDLPGHEHTSDWCPNCRPTRRREELEMGIHFDDPERPGLATNDAGQVIGWTNDAPAAPSVVVGDEGVGGFTEWWESLSADQREAAQEDERVTHEPTPHPDDLADFTIEPRCPKCLAKSAEMTWHLGGKTFLEGDPLTEHLAVKCARCDYTWEMRPADMGADE